MKRRVTACVAWMAAFAVAGTAMGQEKKEGSKAASAGGAKVGQAAPDFTLTDCHGKTVKLSELKGKVVVLEWISFDCPVSLQCSPTMKKTAEMYGAKGVIWLGVDSTNFHKAEDNATFIKDKSLPYTILSDFDGATGRAYGAKTTPHMFVIDKSGVLAYAGAIDDQKERNYVAEAIDALLADKPVAVSETKPYGCSVKYKK